MTTLSFEFFPPKDSAGAAQLQETVRSLAPLKPAFMTVTFGAGGTTRDGTRETITDLQRLSDRPIGAHLTFFGTPRDELMAYVDGLWDLGVRELVALRGDAPKDSPQIDPKDPIYFQKTGEFVAALKSRHPFNINVGAYPEMHPASPSRAADLAALREKMDAGADRAISQFFFDNTLYYRFLDEVTAAGIKGTFIPGIMPINDFDRVRSFAGKCGASIPATLAEKFEKLGDNQTERKKVAVDFLAAQLDDLMKHGVPHIHLYTLNRSELILSALNAPI